MTAIPDLDTLRFLRRLKVGWWQGEKFTVWSWRRFANGKMGWYPERDGISLDKATLVKRRVEAKTPESVLVLPDGFEPWEEWGHQAEDQKAKTGRYSVWCKPVKGDHLVERVEGGLSKQDAESLKRQIEASELSRGREFWVEEESNG